MKIQAVGLQRKAIEEYIREHFPKLKVVDAKPDVIICYGGDGTLLYGEREFPRVPKVMMRNSLVCANCAERARQTILQLLTSKEYTIVEYTKLAAESKGNHLLGLNDIVVGTPRVNGTLRARVAVNGRPYGTELLGDGVVVSTPIGSTGYYQSITQSNFEEGIGLAFNNSVNVISHLVLRHTDEVTVEVTRGPGAVVADNDEKDIPLSTGDVVTIHVADHKAKIVTFSEEYNEFNVNTGASRIPLGFCQICRQPYDR